MNHYSTPTESDMVESSNIHLIILFDVIHFTNLVAISTLLLTAWISLRIRRASTWFCAVGVGLVSSSGNLMLLGRQRGPPPTPGSHLCLFQASLIHASAVLASVYAAAYILQVYMFLLLVRNSIKVMPRKHIILLHAVPCVSFVIAFVGFLSYGIYNPTAPQRSPSGMYCHIFTLVNKISAGVALTAMVIIGILEGLILSSLFRARWTFPDARQENEIVSKGSIIRVLIFSLGPMAGLAVSAYQYFHPHTASTAVFTILLSIIPLFIVILFGSQKDILHVWLPFRCHLRQNSGSS